MIDVYVACGFEITGERNAEFGTDTWCEKHLCAERNRRTMPPILAHDRFRFRVDDRARGVSIWRRTRPGRRPAWRGARVLLPVGGPAVR